MIARIRRAQGGNFGDSKLLPNTSGVYEMRIFKGNGYRIQALNDVARARTQLKFGQGVG